MINETVSEQLTLELKKFAASQGIPADAFKVFVAEDMGTLIGMAQSAVLYVERMVWGKQLGTVQIRVPLDWWEHFKERWFPTWALARWPVRYRTLASTGWHLYPKLPVRGHDPATYSEPWKPAQDEDDEGSCDGE